jgi:large subunit ribosomal protein L28
MVGAVQFWVVLRLRAASNSLESPMSKICQVTGKKPHFGKQLSHSHRRTSRRWDPNVQTKRYYLPSEKRWIKLNLSTKGIKTIDKRGIERVVADMRAAGQKI